MSSRSQLAAFAFVSLAALALPSFTSAQAESAGGAAAGSETTFKPKSRPKVKRTTSKAVTKAGKSAAAYQADGENFYKQKDYDSALVAFQNAVKIKPTPRALYMIGWLQNDFEEFDQALFALNQAIALNPSYSSAYLEKGYSLRRLKRDGEAAVALNKSVQLDSTSATAYYELGLAYYNLKRFDDSASALTNATAIKPDYGDAYQQLGISLRRANRNDEAIAALNKAIQLQPEDSDGYMALGDVYFLNTKEYRKAMVAYKHGLQYDASNYVAAYNVGWVCNDIGNYSEAITWLTQATGAKSDYVDAFNELGFSYLKSSKYGEALTALRRASSVQPRNEITHYYLGQVYVANGNRNGAMAEYRTLQQLSSEYAPKLYNMINK